VKIIRYQQPTTNNQNQPTTNNQQPTTKTTNNQQPTTTNATTYNKEKMSQAFLDMQERRVDLPSGSSKRGCGGGSDDGWSSRDQQLGTDIILVAHNRRRREYSHRRDHGRGGGRIDSRGDGWNRSTLPSPQMNGDRHHRCCHRTLSLVMTIGP
jgi:hypothetical protein